MFVSLSEFKKKFPNERKKWMVFAYTKPVDARGYNLPELAKKLGLQKNILFPEHLPQMVGLPDLEMAKLYSSFNVLLNASRREGFCIPIIEAQACGIPIIASDSSSLPELVKGHGWMVKMGEKVFAPKGWECRKVDRDDLLKKMEDAYFNAELRRTYASQSLQFAQKFDWSKIVSEQWIPLLEKLKSTSLK
jgi:glycosyltransferase involved in cell wall biosynthesis